MSCYVRMRSSTDKFAGGQAVRLDVGPVGPTHALPFATTREIRHVDVGPLDVEAGVVEVDFDNLESKSVRATMGCWI